MIPRLWKPAIAQCPRLALMALTTLACSGEPQPEMAQQASVEDTVCQRTAVGVHNSPTGQLVLEVSQLDAGRERIELRDSSGSVLWSHDDDVSSVLWLPDASGFVFSTSPVYGVPGLHLFAVASRRVTKLVGAQSSGVQGYPDGADWFSVCAVREVDGHFALDYVYYPHVDSAAFEQFPSGGERRAVALP